MLYIITVSRIRTTMNLEDLLQRAEVWRGGGRSPTSGFASGYPALDSLLNGGWPPGALVEILSAHRGIGELRLLLPVLATLTREKRWLAFVAPPYLPYAPALERAGVRLDRVLQVYPRTHTDTLWVLEQTLRSGSAVLAWPQTADARGLRRLQLAAEAGDSLGFLFRRPEAGRESSPAAVRLRLTPARTATGLSIEVLKRRGGWPTGPIDLEVMHALALSGFSETGTGNLHPRA